MGFYHPALAGLRLGNRSMSIFYPLSALSPSRTGRATMAAAVFAKPGCVELREAPIPVPGAREVCVRLEGCGVCKSSVAAWLGEDGRSYPLASGAPGSEAWGRVESVGEEVGEVAPGDRVGALIETGFAEYAVVEAQRLVVLPETLDAEPFPTRALAGAVNVFRRSLIEKGDTVAVVGFGFLGALVTQLAVLAEARVIAVGRRPSALRIAKQLGAAGAVVQSDEKPPRRVVETVREMNGGRQCDVVIEASGVQGGLDLAAELTRERGRLVVAGSRGDGCRFVDMSLWNRRGFDVVNAHETSPAILREGMREAAAAVACGLLQPGPLYTHRFSLDRLEDALRLVAQRPPGFMKALIYF